MKEFMKRNIFILFIGIVLFFWLFSNIVNHITASIVTYMKYSDLL
jgi:hypothetical protein